MKRAIWFVSLLLAFEVGDRVVAQQPAQGRPAPGSTASIPDLAYEQVEWPRPATNAAGTPAPWNLIQVSSVAVTPRGTILVLHRGAHPVLEFDAGGQLLRSWGDGLFSEGKVAAIPKQFWTADKSHYSAVYGPAGCDSCGAHSVRIDREGNIWLVDAPGHVIFRMDANGKEIARVGTRGVSGQTAATFNLPTDVAFAANGDFYVTDGYGGARVLRFSAGGALLRQWGARGSGPGQFDLPHNLVVDQAGRVYVTDRENQRVEVFESDGAFLAQWPTGGGVSALALTPDGRQIWTGGVLRSLDGTPVGKLPGAVGSPHGMIVTPSGDIYLAQLSGTVQKFVKKP